MYTYVFYESNGSVFSRHFYHVCLMHTAYRLQYMERLYERNKWKHEQSFAPPSKICVHRICIALIALFKRLEI